MVAGDNLITNPGAEAATTGWSASNSAVVTRTTTAGQFRSGVGGFLVTNSATAATVNFLGAQVAVVAGEYVEWYFWVKAAATARSPVAQMDFFNGATYLSTGTGTAVTTNTTSFVQVRHVFLAPATATLATPYLGTPSVAASEVFYVDDAYARVLIPTPKRGRR